MKRKQKKCSFIFQNFCFPKQLNSCQTDMNSVPSITVNGKIIERVTNFKLLGVISSDLSWHARISYMLQKVSKRIFCINNLARAGIYESDIIQVYISIIRSVLEYACPVWHPGLSKAQTNEIERVQKRCLRIIYPKLTYTEALLISGLDTLQSRRENITRDLFREIKDENHILNSLLPKREITSMAVRNSYPYKIPITKVSRYGRGFIPYCISKRF